MSNPLLVVIGTFFVFAVAGFISSCVYQWREWRKRKTIERNR